MQTALTIGLVLSTIVSIVAIVDIVKSASADVRTFSKPMWYVVALVPIIGAVGWMGVGRPERGPSGKRVAKDKSTRGKRQKISADRAVIVDRLTSDIRTRPPRSPGSFADSPRSPGSLSDRAIRSASSAAERSAVSPATAAAEQE